MDKQTGRMNIILNLLMEHGIMKVNDLADRLGVSDMTIRRDLKQMSSEELVKNLHGAVVLNQENQSLNTGDKYFVSKQNEIDREIKIRIAEKAVTFLEPYDNIILDVGSTPYYLARALPYDIPLTVICYSVNTLIELYERENCEIIFAGGYFHRNALMFESEEGIDLIKKHRANRSFIGATGINEKMGVTSSNRYEMNIKQAAMQSSLSKILLVNSSKFGRVTASYFADLDEFDIVITDDSIQGKYKKLIEDLGIKLYIV